MIDTPEKNDAIKTVISMTPGIRKLIYGEDGPGNLTDRAKPAPKKIIQNNGWMILPNTLDFARQNLLTWR